MPSKRTITVLLAGAGACFIFSALLLPFAEMETSAGRDGFVNGLGFAFAGLLSLYMWQAFLNSADGVVQIAIQLAIASLVAAFVIRRVIDDRQSGRISSGMVLIGVLVSFLDLHSWNAVLVPSAAGAWVWRVGMILVFGAAIMQGISGWRSPVRRAAF